jgi:hypothetical protein
VCHGRRRVLSRGRDPVTCPTAIGHPNVRTTPRETPKTREERFELLAHGYVTSDPKAFETALGRGIRMWLLVILALVAALFIGLGFVVKWLFIVAVILALVWLIAFFAGGLRSRA